MQFTRTQKLSAAWAAIAAVVVALVWLLGPALTPFIAAVMLAYALNPVVNWLDRRFKGKLPRVLAVLLVELLAILLVVALFLMVLPILFKQLPRLVEQLPTLADRLDSWLLPYLQQWGVEFRLDTHSIKEFVLKFFDANLEEGIGSVLNSLKIGGSVLMTLVGYLVLIPVALFFLLLDWDGFVKSIDALVPRRWHAPFHSFMDEADEMLGQYLRGQLLVMGIMALYFSIGMALFGLKLAFPIGIFTGMAMFIPFVGFGMGLVLALLAGLLELSFAKTVVMLVAVYGSGQVLESFVLTPRLVGQRIGLHPLMVIFALMAFGQLFGFVGVLLALPATAVLFVALRRVRQSYLASPLYKGP